MNIGVNFLPLCNSGCRAPKRSKRSCQRKHKSKPPEQWDFLPQVIDVAVRRLPALRDAAMSHAWAGLYEMTPDANPLIGPAAGVDGFYLITGFSGHGFQHSPAAGRILADLIAGRDPRFDLSPFAPDRFARGAGAGERYVV